MNNSQIYAAITEKIIANLETAGSWKKPWHIKTKGMVYYVNPEFLRKVSFKGKTNLKKIEDHRLRELIIIDLRTYPESSLSDIHPRIGKEIKILIVRKQLNKLIEDKTVRAKGSRKFRIYSLFSQGT